MNVIKDAMDETLSNMSMSQQMKEKILQTTGTKHKKSICFYKRRVVIAAMVTILVLASTTVGAAVNGGWLNEFTRWWSEPIQGTDFTVPKTESLVDGVSIIMYNDINGDFYFELTNASEATPVIDEDSIEIRITKKEGSNITLMISEKDAFNTVNYQKRHGIPTEGEIIQSKSISYVVVNELEE